MKGMTKPMKKAPKKAMPKKSAMPKKTPYGASKGGCGCGG